VNRAAAAALALMVLPACAPALREPPDLSEMAGEAGAAGPDEASDLLQRADALRAERKIESTREAARIYLEAANADPGEIDGLIGSVRANAWLADRLGDREERREAAVAAVHAGQWCERVDASAAACPYWLAVALGVQARERRSTGHDAVGRIVELLDIAIQRDPLQDEAGPHRVLALVLLRAPGWPTGPGDPDLGLEQAMEAVRLRPDYPPNQLCLGEALKATEDPMGSERAYQKALQLARAEEAGFHEDDVEHWSVEATEAILALGGAD
jgi:hypothetical protein